MARVALARSDRNIIVVTASALILAGLFFVSVLLFATGSDTPTSAERGPLYIGPKRDLVAKLDEGSPLYFANPFGGRGFWLDREAGSLIALDVGTPGDVDCSAKWKDPVDAYVDCDGNRLTKDDLARYDLTVVARGPRKGSVFVDLSHRPTVPSS